MPILKCREHNIKVLFAATFIGYCFPEQPEFTFLEKLQLWPDTWGTTGANTGALQNAEGVFFV